MRSWRHLEHQKTTRRAPRSSQEAPKKLPRSPQEAPKRLLGGALGALGGPKSSPSHDPRYIHRFQSLQEPSRRSPSHDLSALPTFQSLQKRDEGVRSSREPDVSRARSAPRTRSRTRFLYLYILVSNLNADAPSSPEGRRIIRWAVLTIAYL